MSEPKAYDRQPSDTGLSWRAFCDYLELGSDRTLEALHQLHINLPSTPPTKSFTTLKTWCADKNWVERAQAYDLDQGKRLIEAIAQKQHEQALERIKEFAIAHLNSGKGGMDIALRLKKNIVEFLQRPDTRIEDWADAVRAAKVLSVLELASSEAWGKAIGIDKILDQIEVADEG